MDDDERSSDTSETYGGEDAPGTVSGQNAEEDPAPGDAGGTSGATQGGSDQEGSEKESSGRGDSSGDPSRLGGAGEGSQSTGNPLSAG